MIEATTFIRVRYSETDQMGYVYYGNYASYFEVGRVELFRSIGLSYKELEDDGVMMPVINLSCFYHHPARYDDLLKIVTSIPQLADGVRITFNYKIYNQNELLIHEGKTELVFVDKSRNKPCRMPKKLWEKLQNYPYLKSL
ncbi:MAG: thioesterase family protein [Flavobacteriaceae bacterium]|nr:thioesterase family protein [Flavobacteriaceae bacterium]